MTAFYFYQESKIISGSADIEYRQFANRSHYICGELGWEVAIHVYDWIELQHSDYSGRNTLMHTMS
ncbi:hypothetical protein [Xanthocytophaga flava]|uniref:hypothetical protein n=1 Tax=Xanthocytophaga flava TaxID=3048013 RepID=UPI0028D7016D|nr:hypothetical protein [Xanthocytophaga flavus]MDJ1469234.1 hypothetical protein [Xanthocytophaga flavus]